MTKLSHFQVKTTTFLGDLSVAEPLKGPFTRIPRLFGLRPHRMCGVRTRSGIQYRVTIVTCGCTTKKKKWCHSYDNVEIIMHLHSGNEKRSNTKRAENI